MGWIDYYRILERHRSFTRAPKEELRAAARTNPNDPMTAMYIASRKFEAKYPRLVCTDRKGLGCDEERCYCNDPDDEQEKT